MEARKQLANIFKVLKKQCQPRTLYLAKLFSKNKGDIKIFPGKQKLRKFVCRLALQEMVKRVLQAEIKRH